MSTTQITTAARRIARTLNSTPAYSDAILDEDGRLIETVEHGNTNPTTTQGLRLQGRQGSRWGRITQAEAQEATDMRAARLAH